MENFSQTYPNVDLYFACNPMLMTIIDGNPHVTKTLPYHENMEDELAMIGRGTHEGYVDYYINLNQGLLKNLSAVNAHAV